MQQLRGYIHAGASFATAAAAADAGGGGDDGSVRSFTMNSR